MTAVEMWTKAKRRKKTKTKAKFLGIHHFNRGDFRLKMTARVWRFRIAVKLPSPYAKKIAEF